MVKPDKYALANVKARARMVLLFEYTNMTKSLVCGTSNKSEILTGYFTKYGEISTTLYSLTRDVWMRSGSSGIATPALILEQSKRLRFMQSITALYSFWRANSVEFACCVITLTMPLMQRSISS